MKEKQGIRALEQGGDGTGEHWRGVTMTGHLSLVFKNDWDSTGLTCLEREFKKGIVVSVCMCVCVFGSVWRVCMYMCDEFCGMCVGMCTYM